MSNLVNEELLNKAQDAIDIASQHCEYWVGTTVAKTLDMYVAQVTKHIKDNNLEDLYNYSLPALEKRLFDSAMAMSDESIAHFYGYDILPRELGDEY